MTDFPSPEQISKWKQEYGKVLSASMFGDDYVFRVMKFRELREIQKIKDQTEAEDAIVERCLLFPSFKDLEDRVAGVVSSLAEEIIDFSCFMNPDRAKLILQEEKEKAEDVWTAMKSIVLMAMPSYKYDELDDMTFEEMSRLVALSEKVIRLNQQLMGVDSNFEFVLTEDGEEEEAPQQEAKPANPSQDPIAAKLHQAIQ